MTLSEKIERVFAHRGMPDAAVDTTGLFQIDSDVEEALWFSGRDWHGLTWRDWQDHSCAIFFFDPGAFAYYLPSLLLLSARNPSESLDAADSLLSQLDRSPDPEGWTDGFVSRFLGLNTEELDVLKEWLFQVCEYVPYKGVGLAASGPGDTFGRAFDTINLVQKEVERRRTASR